MVNTYNMIVSKNARMYEGSRINKYLVPGLYLFMGSVFVGFSLLYGEGLFSLGGLFGIGLLGFGAVCFHLNRKTFARS
jgi:hypothetical protein